MPLGEIYDARTTRLMNPSRVEVGNENQRVMAVHNEALYLIYSLPVLKQIPFDELIFVLDRCTDDSEEIIRRLAPHSSRMMFKQEQHWVYTRACEAFQIGFDKARNDLVFALGADLILTPRALTITEDLMQNPKVRSWEISISVTIAADFTKIFFFYAHERLWERISWGRVGK